MKTPNTRAQFAQKVIAAQPTEKMLFNAINVLDQCRVENRTLLEAAKEAWAVMYRAAYPMPVNDVIKPMDVATDFTKDESKPEETPPGWEWTRNSVKGPGWHLVKRKSAPQPAFNPVTQGYQPVRQDDRPIPPPPGPVDKSKTNAEYVRRLLSESAEALELALKGECSQSNGAALVQELKSFAKENQPDPGPIATATTARAASISKTAEVMASKEQLAFERKFGHFNMQKSGQFDYLDRQTAQLRQVWLQAINWAFADCFDPKGDRRND